MDDINCNDLVELVTDCLEQALDSQTLLRVLDHLHLCEGCDSYFNQVLVAVKVVSNLPASPVPAALETNLMTLYRQWTEEAVA